MPDTLSLIVANTVSGAAIVAIAFAAWQLKQRSDAKTARHSVLLERSSRLKLLADELETIISFTEKSELAASALEQFTSYQQWLVANALLSWKQNRLAVQTWQQPTGAALKLRLGQIAIPPEVLADLVADMRKTELPTPEDDHFRWHPKPVAPPAE